MENNSTKRNYKDSVFVDLFGKCKDSKANFLSLYNAMTGNNYKLENTEIEPLMLEQTIYTGRYNDVSMLINNRLIVLVEQQSTINENMPLRFLEYVTKLYEKIIPGKNRYKYKKIPIPVPEFYVIYNGKDDYPAEKILKLSDSFMLENDNNDKKISLEILVKVFNINKERGGNLLVRCIPLSGYARLVELVLEKKELNIANPVDEAVKQCIKEGVLVDYFNYNSTEVRNMLIDEYDYDTDVEVRQEEAREDVALNMLKEGKLNLEEISKYTELPLEKVKIIAKEYSNQVKNK